MPEYAFDVKMFATVRVNATSEKAARMALADINNIDLYLTTNTTYGPLQIVSASLDDNEAETTELLEIDGEAV